MLTNEEVLQRYKTILPFLSELMGPNCEIILHSTLDYNKSIISIENGHISGRKLGGPLNGFGRECVENKIYEKKDYLTNYYGTGNGKEFISSTYFIKNEGKIVGLLCINKDLTSFQEVEKAFKKFKKTYNFIINDNSNIKENLEEPLNDLLIDMINAVVDEYNVDPKRMEINDKIKIVHKLKEKGIFTMKNSIKATARILYVSEPTIYRYLKK